MEKSYPFSSSSICAKLCTNMPWSSWKRLVQKKTAIFFSSYCKCLALLTSLNACDGSGHIFGASTSPRSLTKKLDMSPPSTVHGGQHDTTYVTFELLLHAAFMADEIRGFMLESARRRRVSVQMWRPRPPSVRR